MKKPQEVKIRPVLVSGPMNYSKKLFVETLERSLKEIELALAFRKIPSDNFLSRLLPFIWFSNKPVTKTFF